MEATVDRMNTESAQARRDMAEMVKFSGALLFCVLLVTQPRLCRQWAGEALRDWATNIVPALLPFLMALPNLTGEPARSVYRSVLGWMMRPFGLPGEMAGVTVVGLLAGSPASAAALRISGRGLNRGQGLRLAALTSGAGPVFYVSFVARLAGSTEAARMMYLCQWLSAAAVALVLRRAYRNETPLRPEAEEAGGHNSILTAIRQVLHIGGCMVLFSILGQAAGRYAGDWAFAPIMALMEMTGGVQALARTEIWEIWRLPLMGGCCCLGGVSILSQNLHHLRPAGIPAGLYVGVRAAHALLDVMLLRMIL